MDNSIYTILASSVGGFDNLAVISNNVANSNTVGYKVDTAVFSQYITPDVSDTISMPNDFSVASNQQQGTFKTTSRRFDFAIGKDGFFAVQTPLGIRYTRRGEFMLDQDGVLVTHEGYPVLNNANTYITLAPEDKEPSVSAEGVIYVYNGIDRLTKEQRGTIGVFRFESPKFLRKTQDALFVADLAGPPTINASPEIVQGSLEESNVNPITEISQLIEVQRNADISASLIEGIYGIYKNATKIMAKQTI